MQPDKVANTETKSFAPPFTCLTPILLLFNVIITSLGMIVAFQIKSKVLFFYSADVAGAALLMNRDSFFVGSL